MARRPLARAAPHAAVTGCGRRGRGERAGRGQRLLPDSNGSFYWLSPSVADPSLGGWVKNLGDWYLPYLANTTLYLAGAAALHLLGTLLFRTLAAHGDRALSR